MEPIGRFLIFLANEHLQELGSHEERGVHFAQEIIRLQLHLTPQDSHQKMNDYIIDYQQNKSFRILILPFYISTTAPLPFLVSFHSRCLQACWIAIVEGKLPEECQVQDRLRHAADPARQNPGEIA